MKHFSITLIIGAYVFLNSASSIAQSKYEPEFKCQPIEFSELQTYNDIELQAAQCKAVKNLKDATDWEKMNRRKGFETAITESKNSTVFLKNADEYKNDATICTQQIERINRLLSKKSLKGC